jgi:hypothetical protein
MNKINLHKLPSYSKKPHLTSMPPRLIPKGGRVHHSVHIHTWRAAILKFKHMFPNSSNILQHTSFFIEHGVHCNIHTPIPRRHIANSHTVLTNPKIIRSTISEFLSLSFIKELDFVPSLTHPLLLVLKPSKPPRLCIDLKRNFNSHTHTPNFSYQNIYDVVNQSYPNCHFAIIDISKCFLSFKLHPDTSKLINFFYNNVYYQFIRMPFGLKSAPSFNELLLSLVSFILTYHNITHVRYVDDIIIIGNSYRSCLHSLYTAIDIIQSFGLAIAINKIIYPSKSIIFIGIGIDSRNQTLYIPSDKAHNINTQLSSLLLSNYTTLHSIQSICGKLNHLSCVAKGIKPFARSLIDLTCNTHNPSRILLTSSQVYSINYLTRFLPIFHKSCLWFTPTPTWRILHDASTTGFGSIVNLSPYLETLYNTNSHFTCGIFDNIDIHSHTQICFAELFAIFASLYKYTQLGIMHDCSVHVITDNISDVFIIKKHTTTNHDLLYLLQLITHIVNIYNIILLPSHIPGKKNIIADFLSRPSLHDFHLPVSLSSSFCSSEPLIDSTSDLNSLYSYLLTRPFPFTKKN